MARSGGTHPARRLVAAVLRATSVHAASVRAADPPAGDAAAGEQRTGERGRGDDVGPLGAAVGPIRRPTAVLAGVNDTDPNFATAAGSGRQVSRFPRAIPGAARPVRGHQPLLPVDARTRATACPPAASAPRSSFQALPPTPQLLPTPPHP